MAWRVLIIPPSPFVRSRSSRTVCLTYRKVLVVPNRQRRCCIRGWYTRETAIRNRSALMGARAVVRTEMGRRGWRVKKARRFALSAVSTQCGPNNRWTPVALVLAGRRTFVSRIVPSTYPQISRGPGVAGNPCKNTSVFSSWYYPYGNGSQGGASDHRLTSELLAVIYFPTPL